MYYLVDWSDNSIIQEVCESYGEAKTRQNEILEDSGEEEKYCEIMSEDEWFAIFAEADQNEE